MIPDPYPLQCSILVVVGVEERRRVQCFEVWVKFYYGASIPVVFLSSATLPVRLSEYSKTYLLIAQFNTMALAITNMLISLCTQSISLLSPLKIKKYRGGFLSR